MKNRLRMAALALAACFTFQIGDAVRAEEVAASPRASLPAGESSFTFRNWDGPAFKVWAIVPDDIDRAQAPVLIMLHGASRAPERDLDKWRDVAQRRGFIAIAPEFSRRIFPSSREYNLGHLANRGSTALRPRAQWTFAAIEPLFDDVVARLGSSQQGYTLYGHSAGSQFAHRFLLTQRGTRALRILAANAGWYTLPTFALDYPYGLNGTDLSTADLKVALAADVVILLGDADTDEQDPSLNRSDGAMMQGENRFARGQYFYNFGREMALRQGWEYNWSVRIVPGVAHENRGIALAAGDLVVGARALPSSGNQP